MTTGTTQLQLIIEYLRDAYPRGSVCPHCHSNHTELIDVRAHYSFTYKDGNLNMIVACLDCRTKYEWDSRYGVEWEKIPS